MAPSLRYCLVVCLVALMMAVAPADAADLPVIPKSPPTASPAIPTPFERPAAAAPRSLAPNFDPSCKAWSDGCRSCSRSDDGVACSNPGIACQPGEDVCTQR